MYYIDLQGYLINKRGLNLTESADFRKLQTFNFENCSYTFFVMQGYTFRSVQLQFLWYTATISGIRILSLRKRESLHGMNNHASVK